MKDKDASFLGLAHDVRRAYERQREIIQPPKHFEEIGVRCDVLILWPVLWLQRRLLRRFLAFLDVRAKLSLMRWRPSSMMHCARIWYAGRYIIDLWQRLNPAQPAVFEMIDRPRGYFFRGRKRSGRPTLRCPFLVSIRSATASTQFHLRTAKKPDISRKIRCLGKIWSGIRQTVSTLVTALLCRQAEISLLSLQIGRLSEVLPIPILVGISAADAPLPREIFRKHVTGAARIRSLYWFW